MSLRNRADAPENFELIRTWLKKCETHPRCGQPLVPTSPSIFRLPKHVLDVSPNENSNEIKLVLGESIDASNDCRYITLSHCWGDPKKVPKTVKSNLVEHQQRILVDSLSKTFQDAICITREVGLKYLWIDSLCIIQHSDQEFAEECAQMHHVYSRAFCTLAAEDSADGSGGLFIPRNPDNQSTESWDTVPSGPLSTRGWAYQEHQLSPRVLHFMKSRIVWECRVSIASEDYPYQMYRSLGSMNLESISRWRIFDGRMENCSLVPVPRLDVDFDRREDIYIRWMEAIEIYSAKRLSFQSDRQPAISGLASAFGDITGDNYLFGHWQKDLARSLCWTPDIFRERCNASATFREQRLPSWSWISHHGPIQYLKTMSGLRVYGYVPVDGLEFLPLAAVGSESNGANQTPSSSLQVKGDVLTVQIQAGRHKSLKIERSTGNDFLLRGFSMIQLESQRELDPVILLDPDSERPIFTAKTLDVVCLELMWSRVTDQESLIFMPSGLVLLPLSDGTFRRIGIYGNTPAAEVRNGLRKFRNRLHKFRNRLHNTEKKIIRIV